MIEAYKDYWKRYFDFKGVTNKAGYWWVFLCNIIIGMIISTIAGLTEQAPELAQVFTYIDYAWSAVTFIPGLAICVRRMRDAGYKWTNCFLALIPIVGPIIVIVKLCKPTKVAD